MSTPHVGIATTFGLKRGITEGYDCTDACFLLQLCTCIYPRLYTQDLIVYMHAIAQAHALRTLSHLQQPLSREYSYHVCMGTGTYCHVKHVCTPHWSLVPLVTTMIHVCKCKPQAPIASKFLIISCTIRNLDRIRSVIRCKQCCQFELGEGSIPLIAVDRTCYSYVCNALCLPFRAKCP